jgi:tetraacyldisaccharide 4'-kinase
LKDEIRRYNPAVPIFLAQTVAYPPPLDPRRPITAFCGLGQPESFRRTLAELGIRPAHFEIFPDHYHYTEADLARLDGQLITTEKDMLNIQPALAARLGVQAVAMALEVPVAEELLAATEECLRARAAGV